jgi:hypothetical protein
MSFSGSGDRITKRNVAPYRGLARLGSAETNNKAAMHKLNCVGLDDLRIISSFVNGQGSDVPSHMNEKCVYIIGGFDPKNLQALMGLDAARENMKDFLLRENKDETPLDDMVTFLSQPIFALEE